MPVRTLALLVLAAAMPAPPAQAQGGLQRCVDQVLRTEGGRVARVVAEPTLSLRVEPSLTAPIMRSIPDGAPIVVLRREGAEWLHVIAIDATPGCVVQIGYVASQYVR